MSAFCSGYPFQNGANSQPHSVQPEAPKSTATWRLFYLIPYSNSLSVSVCSHLASCHKVWHRNSFVWQGENSPACKVRCCVQTACYLKKAALENNFRWSVRHGCPSAQPLLVQVRLLGAVSWETTGSQEMCECQKAVWLVLLCSDLCRREVSTSVLLLLAAG